MRPEFFAEMVDKFFTAAVQPYVERIAALEAAREKTLADAFQGGWLAGRTYKRGSLVQHADALWLALDDSDARPGQSSAWRALAPTR